MRKDRVVSEVLGESVAVTPSDLYSADFKTVFMGGYDRNEVDTLLERTADVFETLLNQLRDLREQIEAQKEQISSFHEMESTLRNALVSSQKYSENVVDAARREADAIVEQARLERVRAQSDAAQLPGHLRDEIEELQQARDRVRNDLLSLLEVHRGLIEEIPAAEGRIVRAEASEAAPEAEAETVADEQTEAPNENDG